MSDQNSKTFEAFIQDYQHLAFQGGQLAKACDIIEEIFRKKEPISIFLALSGALVPAGLQPHLIQLLKTGKITGLVTTGATLTHDYIEDIGYSHHKLHSSMNDTELRNKGINRIYDVGASNEAFESLEKKLHSWMSKKYKNSQKLKIVSTPSFLKSLGNELTENSILGQCAHQNIPIYCPAIMDSILGVQTYFFSESGNKFMLDSSAELKQFISQCFDSKTTAAIVLGGGVPKNYLFQGMMISGRELQYAIQITMDRPEHGGLSGATLEEAISWGKINPENAKLATIVADVTLIFPLIVKFIDEIIL